MATASVEWPFEGRCMIGWHQLPVWSPISLRSLAGALPAATRGSGHRKLRELLSATYPRSEFVLADSGTSALAIAMLVSAPPGRTPRIALPAYGCFDLVTAADIAGAEVVFYDLDPATLAPRSIDQALASGVDAVVVAHWFGLPVDLLPIQRAAQAVGVLLIEDAAQGLGVRVGPQPAGATGDFGILSFGRGKGRTGGRGGALVMRPGASRRPLPPFGAPKSGWKTAAQLATQWLLGRPETYWVPASIPGLGLGVTHYHRPHPVGSLEGFAAGAVAAIWDRSDQETAVRQRQAESWRRLIAELGVGESFTPEPGTTAGWLRFPVRLDPGSRSRVGAAREFGVMPGYPRLLPELEPHRAVFLPPNNDYPGARELVQSLATFPTHSLVKKRDWDGCVRAFFRPGVNASGGA